MDENEIGFSYPDALDFATVNDWVHGDRMFEELQCACLGMATEIEKLRADAKRLDWLADPANTIGNVQLPTEAVTANLHSLRDAIDAAMAMPANA
jgi:hypothetical protein